MVGKPSPSESALLAACVGHFGAIRELPEMVARDAAYRVTI